MAEERQGVLQDEAVHRSLAAWEQQWLTSRMRGGRQGCLVRQVRGRRAVWAESDAV